jgi:hypothetical protein
MAGPRDNRNTVAMAVDNVKAEGDFLFCLEGFLREG